ncbi:peptidoglycan DD-metalloendopeptidase family protein [Georgenia sp. Z1344]|uniref:peptidoglycan DD-metalloendopeptidase family protein n=1 Tax=Georgenia sp. Z1344 TaxID=3416706 RepID=UPI003CE7A6C6
MRSSLPLPTGSTGRRRPTGLSAAVGLGLLLTLAGPAAAGPAAATPAPTTPEPAPEDPALEEPTTVPGTEDSSNAPDDADTPGATGPDALPADPAPSDDPLREGELVPQTRSNAPITAGPLAQIDAPPAGNRGIVGPLGSNTYALTSYMGPRCIPIMYGSTSHGGVDFGAPAGTPLYAIADGVVVNQLNDPVAGEWLLVRHTIDGRHVFASYSHTLDRDRYVRVGDTVRAGQRIADVGSTGVSTAPHLHLEIWLDAYLRGTRVEPIGWFSGRGVDLREAAVRAVPMTTPATCRYYAIGSTPIRASASSGARVLTTVPNFTPMTGWPGDKTGDWVRVRANGVTGWAHASDVSPVRSGEPQARTTAATILRSSRAFDAGNQVASLGAGARIDVVDALIDGWYRVTVGSRSGWLHHSTVAVTPGVRHGIDEGFFLADTFTTSATSIFGFGSYYDRFYVGDWDGNGTDTVAYRREATYRIRQTNSPGNPDVTINYGRPDDEVYVGDWDGDGTDTFAVRRGNEFHIRNSLTSGVADVVLQYGRAGDEVLVGDWDGDGTDTFTVRRGNEFFVSNTMESGWADAEISYGRAGDDVYVGDWDADGEDTFAVRRGFTYFVRNSMESGWADTQIDYGRAADETYVGDWDGDGSDTLGIYRFS